MELTKTELKNFQKARIASGYSSFPKKHLGAVIFYKNKVLTVGWNTNKEILLQRKYNVLKKTFDVTKYPNYAHAEMMCLHKLINTFNLRKIDKTKLSIFVWRGKDRPMLSKPCIACETALREFGIVNIYYTGNDSYVYQNLLRG